MLSKENSRKSVDQRTHSYFNLASHTFYIYNNEMGVVPRGTAIRRIEANISKLNSQNFITQ